MKSSKTIENRQARILAVLSSDDVKNGNGDLVGLSTYRIAKKAAMRTSQAHYALKRLMADGRVEMTAWSSYSNKMWRLTNAR